MTLRLGKNISIPDEAITETFGILAARGAGKSNTAAVMAEEMFAAELPFVVIDPVGSWWGLRSSKTGKGPGLDIPLFGGKRGDVPLERTGGRLVADLVVDQRLSCIIDLTDFDSEAAKKQFLLDFARRLYQKNEAPLHLFLEEADDYIPQKPMRDEAQLLRAWENIVRRGRARGLGMTMITQRSASINKNVLTQAQTLIAMRTTGPQDRKAIEEWVKYNDQSLDILKTLSGLADGEAWIWSPQFLKKTERVKFRRRRTFDSGSTPKMAAKSKTARLADVDVDQLRDRMAETIKRAEADDPKLLKKRIAELERKAKTVTAADPEETGALRRQVAERDAQIVQLKQHAASVAGELKGARDRLTAVAKQVAAVSGLLRDSDIDIEIPPVPELKDLRATPKRAPPKSARTAFPAKPLTAAVNGASIGKGETKILTAIAQHSEGVDREQLTVLTGYKRSSRDTYLQRLRSMELVDIGPPITATSAGLAALGSDFEPLPTGADLRDYWLNRLSGGERAILEFLISHHPAEVPRDDVSTATNYKRSSRDTYLQRLKARQLVDVSTGTVRASDKLF